MSVFHLLVEDMGNLALQESRYMLSEVSHENVTPFVNSYFSFSLCNL